MFTEPRTIVWTLIWARPFSGPTCYVISLFRGGTIPLACLPTVPAPVPGFRRAEGVEKRGGNRETEARGLDQSVAHRNPKRQRGTRQLTPAHWSILCNSRPRRCDRSILRKWDLRAFSSQGRESNEHR